MILQKLVDMITNPINEQVAELKKQSELLIVRRKNLDVKSKELDKREHDLVQRELELAKRESLFSDDVLSTKVTRMATKMSKQITDEYQVRLTHLQQKEAELARSAIESRQQLIQEWDRLLHAKQDGVVNVANSQLIQKQCTLVAYEQEMDPEWPPQ